MNQNLIKQLKDQKIYTKLLAHSQTPQLIEILKEAFPKDYYIEQNPDYFRNALNINSCFIASSLEFSWRRISDVAELPLPNDATYVPIEHFFLTIQDIAVKPDNNGAEMIKIFMDNGGINQDNYKGNVYGAFYYLDNNNITNTKFTNPTVELTFSQFKQYFSVMKNQETKNQEQKQIGWKLKESCLQYEKAACDIAFEENNYKKTFSVFPKTNENFSIKSTCEDRLRKAGVLELWFEPVYEEVCKDKIFFMRSKSGTFQLTVQKEGLLYVPDNKILDVQVIKEFIKPENLKYKDYNFTQIISHLDMGCKKAVPVEDIQKCIDYWEENFK